MKVNIKHSGVVKLAVRKDPRRGNLFAAEMSTHIPFPIRRVYFVNNIRDRATLRGGHAHKALSQVIVCANGSFTLHLDDGGRTQNIILDDPSVGVLLGPKLWHTMSAFSKDCVILVLASDRYRERDYIRDYEDFLKTV